MVGSVNIRLTSRLVNLRGEQQSQQAATDAEQHAFHQQLLHDAAALCAQRVTHRHLARASGGAHQQQAARLAQAMTITSTTMPITMSRGVRI